MGVPRFMLQLVRQAPSKWQLLRSLALGNKAGDRTVTSPDGTSLSVRRSGQGTPLVLVHGSLDGIGGFSLVELQLAAKQTVWVYDRRGRGNSGDADEYSLAGEVDDLCAIIAESGDVPHVLAHSYGAVIALQARIGGAPMRSLVVYEPPINGESISAEHIAQIRDAVDEGRLDDPIGGMARQLAGITDQELAIAMAVPPVRKRLRDGVNVVARELDAIRLCDWSGLPVADVPTLVVRGERSAAAAYLRTNSSSMIQPC